MRRRAWQSKVQWEKALAAAPAERRSKDCLRRRQRRLRRRTRVRGNAPGEGSGGPGTIASRAEMCGGGGSAPPEAGGRSADEDAGVSEQLRQCTRSLGLEWRVMRFTQWTGRPDRGKTRGVVTLEDKFRQQRAGEVDVAVLMEYPESELSSSGHVESFKVSRFKGRPLTGQVAMQKSECMAVLPTRQAVQDILVL